jgi:hypothetical protein
MKSDDFCAADDSTLRRWRQFFAKAAPLIAALLTALYMKAANKPASLFRCDSILSNIRAGKNTGSRLSFGCSSIQGTDYTPALPFVLESLSNILSIAKTWVANRNLSK